MIKDLNIFTDGGARGNPGPSAIGVSIELLDGTSVAGYGKTIGHATNNTAEYSAVVSALEWLSANLSKYPDLENLYFYMDSNLVCSQINGIFKIKNANLRNYLFQVKKLEAIINRNIYYKHIPREENKNADRFVNSALDRQV